MYVNLIIQNSKKALKDYLIYFATIILSSGLFYAFLSMSSKDYSISLDRYLEVDMFSEMVGMTAYIITLALSILIYYVNAYMVKRRYKEFGTYILLGMEQKVVSFMFFVEAFIIALVGIIFGILLGVVLSQILTIIVLLTAQQEISFQFKLYFDTAIQTLVFFSILFIVIGFFNVLKLRKIKLIDMMKQDKVADLKYKRKGYVYILSCIAGLISYGVSIVSFLTMYTKIADKTKVNIMIFLAPGIIFFIIGTYCLFHCASYILIILKDRFINYKYEGANLFLIGNIGSKLKSSPMVLATITITLTLGMVSAIASLILSQYTISYLNYRLPYDFLIEPRIVYDIDTDEKIKLNMPYEKIISELSKSPYNGANFLKLKFYSIEDNSKHKSQLAIKLSDYNELRERAGHKKISLNKNEYALQWHKASTQEEINKYIKHTSEMVIGERKIKLAQEGIYNDTLGEYLYEYDKFDTVVYILEDDLLDGRDIVKESLYADLSKNVSYKEGTDLEYEIIPKLFEEKNKKVLISSNLGEQKIVPSIRIKTVEKNEILNASLGIRVIGIYIGAVLFMVSLTILGLKQIMDSIEHKERFIVLRKLGVDTSDINKLILKQISIYFVSSGVISVFGAVSFIVGFASLYNTHIEDFIGSKTFNFYMCTAIFIMMILYLGYFYITYKTFKRNIKE